MTGPALRVATMMVSGSAFRSSSIVTEPWFLSVMWAMALMPPAASIHSVQMLTLPSVSRGFEPRI